MIGERPAGNPGGKRTAGPTRGAGPAEGCLALRVRRRSSPAGRRGFAPHDPIVARRPGAGIDHIIGLAGAGEALAFLREGLRRAFFFPAFFFEAFFLEAFLRPVFLDAFFLEAFFFEAFLRPAFFAAFLRVAFFLARFFAMVRTPLQFGAEDVSVDAQRQGRDRPTVTCYIGYRPHAHTTCKNPSSAPAPPTDRAPAQPPRALHSRSSQPAITPRPHAMPEIVVKHLNCGMPLVCERMDGVKSVGVSWLIPFGAAHDPAEHLGLSAMCAHLLFRGAGDRDARAQADALDRLGVGRGADTQTFRLALSATLLGDNLLDTLPMLVDAVRAPRFEPAAIDAVRDICLQSLEGLDDDPQSKVMLNLRARHAASPVNRSGMGTREGLESITRDALVDVWRAQATPGGSILAIAGDVDAQRVADTLDRLLDGWA